MAASILIADDHPLVLKGLKEFLIERGYNVLASAKNGKEALTLIKADLPDIAILDVEMPFFTGIQIAEACKLAKISTKIILITFEKDEKTYLEAKQLDVFGYILKDFALEELEYCIESVSKNKPYFPPELLKHLEKESTPEGLKLLTATELKILDLIANNKTAKDIAITLFCSPRTIEKHKSNIIRKLNLSRKTNSLLIWTKENQHFLS